MKAGDMGNRCIISVGVMVIAAALAVAWSWREGNMARQQAVTAAIDTERRQLVRTRLDHTLEKFHRFFQETRGSLLVAVEHGGFREYFALPGTPKADALSPERERLRKELETWVLALHRRFPIGETCLIDAQGREHLRVVGGTVEKPEDFSDKEGDSPFFRASMAAKPGEVVTSSPYMSPDSYQWVLAFTTPVAMTDGSAPAFYHFEIPLSVFHAVLAHTGFGYFLERGAEKAEGLPPDQRFLLVNGDGLILADSAREIDFELKAARHPDKTPDLPDYLPPEKIGDYLSPADSLLADPSFRPILEEMKTGKTGLTTARWQGREMLAAFAPVGHDRWSLLHLSTVPATATEGEGGGVAWLVLALGGTLALFLARKDAA